MVQRGRLGDMPYGALNLPSIELAEGRFRRTWPCAVGCNAQPAIDSLRMAVRQEVAWARRPIFGGGTWTVAIPTFSTLSAASGPTRHE